MKSSVIVFPPPPHHFHFPQKTARVYPQYLLLIVCNCVNSSAFSKTEVSAKNLEGRALRGSTLSASQHGNSDLFRRLGAHWRSREGRSFQPSRSWASRVQKDKFQLVCLPYYPLTRRIPGQTRGSSAHLQLCP